MTSNSAGRYRVEQVPVRGGGLRVGIWDTAARGDETASATTVIAVHGVTASHRCWETVASLLPDCRIVAPDLRGRGRSHDLPAPYGMAQHADDLAAVVTAVGVEQAVVLGHSMGGFVAAALQHHYPAMVRSLVLVDGGLPLPAPEGISPEELTTARLGLAKQRLSMTFPDRESYQQLWRNHPAFADNWSDVVAAYIDYDLIGEPPHLRPATPYEAMAEDSDDLQNSGEWLIDTLQHLPMPTPFLRAERGMAGEEIGLYPPDWVSGWEPQLPFIRRRDVLGVNHYTILFSDAGARAVADAVQTSLDGATIAESD